MADKIEVEVTGKSKYETAHLMTVNILTGMEKKKWSEITRNEYLKTVAQCVDALNGIGPG